MLVGEQLPLLETSCRPLLLVHIYKGTVSPIWMQTRKFFDIFMTPGGFFTFDHKNKLRAIIYLFVYLYETPCTI